MCSLVFERMSKFYLRNDFIFKMSSSGQKYFEQLKISQDFILKVISDRKLEFMEKRNETKMTTDIVNEFDHKRPKTFLDIILTQHIEDRTLTETDVKDEVNTFMFAGHDTTAVALTWALFLIGQNRDVQEKMANELFDIFGEDKNGPITIYHCKNMKYMECVIKETLRLYPSVPTVARILEDDFNIDGMILKKGALCHAFFIGLHRDPEVFPNPEKFDPERFQPENSAGRHPYAFVPFSAGSRNCIGQKFAMMEMKTILASIFRNYDVTSIDDVSKIPVVAEIVSRPALPIRIKIKRRLL